MFVLVNYLKKQSPPPQLPAHGDGWIMLKNGKYWHPCYSQSELLKRLTCKEDKKKWHVLITQIARKWVIGQSH